MFPEVAWIVAVNGKNMRGDFVFNEAYSLVKTVVIVKAKIVPKPNGDCLHPFLIAVVIKCVVKLCEICCWIFGAALFGIVKKYMFV